MPKKGTKLKELATDYVPKRLIGRPTLYSEELADKICELIATNPVSVITLIEDNEWMPASATINRWHLEKPEFRAKYTRAKEQQVHEHIQQTFRIADQATQEAQQCDPKVASALVNAAKLRIDTRQWYAGRLAPRIYGENSEGMQDKKDENNLSEAERIEQVKNLLDKVKDRIEQKNKG